jgi:hypothetical protein
MASCSSDKCAVCGIPEADSLVRVWMDCGASVWLPDSVCGKCFSWAMGIMKRVKLQRWYE